MLKRLSIFIAMFVCTLAVLSRSTVADEAKTPASQPTTQPINKKCPTSGDPIDPKVTVEYKGKTIAFCCKDCIADFNKDPEKYLKDLK